MQAADVNSVCNIKQLTDFHLTTSGKRLLLPPIQRSVVWSNEQVINYWDSLLRGYPAGTMMIYRAKECSGAKNQGRDSDGRTIDAGDEDLMLFDGQQRMAAVLLGCAKGQMSRYRKLWVDLGSTPSRSSDLRYRLRMTSTGQPFGYQPDAPNQKADLGKRLEKWSKWADKKKTPEQIFENVNGSDLIDATCAVPFASIWDQICSASVNKLVQALSLLVNADKEIVEDFVKALRAAFEVQVLLQQVPSKVVDDWNEYIRFFARVGQGGTRLSDDELSYSIIKGQYPKIHDRMTSIVRGRAGHLADEVDLVLASLRVAKRLAPWDNANEWDIISRPSPAFVVGLRDRPGVERKFLELVPPAENDTAVLENALVQVRQALAYDKSHHPEGFPSILMGCLPRELIDVLLLFIVMRGTEKWEGADCKILRAFVLHWLLFISDGSKAAWVAFQCCVGGKWSFQMENIRILIGQFERDGSARFLPRAYMMPSLRQQVKEGDHRLRPWADRFTAADKGSERKPGDSIRILSTNPQLIRRALMWLQRHYIAQKFPHYDPTSERDDDLPIDLDHIIPISLFDFRWSPGNCENRLEKDVVSDNFRWQRGVVGNSLGNYRWLAASENRGRRDEAYEPQPDNHDLVLNPEEWQKLIRNSKDRKPWSKDDVTSFQRLIDLRTIALYEEILTKSGLAEILPEEPAVEGAPSGF